MRSRARAHDGKRVSHCGGTGTARSGGPAAGGARRDEDRDGDRGAGGRHRARAFVQAGTDGERRSAAGDFVRWLTENGIRMDIASLESAYRDGTLTPTATVTRIYDEIARTGERPVWIALVAVEKNLSLARALEADA